MIVTSVLAAAVAAAVIHSGTGGGVISCATIRPAPGCTPDVLR